MKAVWVNLLLTVESRHHRRIYGWTDEKYQNLLQKSKRWNNILYLVWRSRTSKYLSRSGRWRISIYPISLTVWEVSWVCDGLYSITADEDLLIKLQSGQLSSRIGQFNSYFLAGNMYKIWWKELIFNIKLYFKISKYLMVVVSFSYIFDVWNDFLLSSHISRTKNGIL